MRHDTANTGRSAVAARWHGDRPWSFATGRGIFSTPVIGADDTIYVGSADRVFYALDRRGRERWRLRTGGIIDAAAAISRYDARLRTAPLTFGSGDERLYHVRTDRGPLPRSRRILWTFRASERPATTQLVNWWEGNVGLAPDGTIMAGSTGGAAYALTPAGRLRWSFQTQNSVWTTPAFAPDGTSFWGSLDFRAFALDRDGHERWSKPAGGYFVASPAIGRDGTVYTASFDRRVYALDPATGAERWSYRTGDHVYASPALGRRGTVYAASTDGSVYALTPGGRLRWRYDTGDAIRSSPVVGRGPRGRGELVYVGSSDGVLYALDGETGRRRWSFDTTPAEPVLRDRDDLNGSPALGRRGVVIAGEHGRVWHVPYDFCLHARDARCSRDPGPPLGRDLRRVFAVSSGGSVLRSAPRAVPPAAVLNARLTVRRGGRNLGAAMQPARSLVSLSPRAPFTTQLSGDGQFAHVVPRGFLRAGTTYRLRVAGRYAPPRVGAVSEARGRFTTTLRFRTAPRGRDLGLRAGPRAVSALTLRRLALPMPAFLTSVNQIGFDSYDLIAGVVDTGPDGRVLLWVIGGRTRDGREVADPRGGFAFPLAGRVRGDSIIVTARDLRLTFSFGDVPMRRFELRGRLTPSLRTRPGSALYAEVTCRDVPVYGAALAAIGLCNETGTLPASGTFLAEGYDPRGPANRRPAGVSLGAVTLRRPTATQAGEVAADLRGALRFEERLVSVLLTDPAGRPLTLDYPRLTTWETQEGSVRRVRVRLPAGTELPARVRAYVLSDVFPLGVRELR
jgi:outer membrane protein assembly factor BamB